MAVTLRLIVFILAQFSDHDPSGWNGSLLLCRGRKHLVAPASRWRFISPFVRCKKSRRDAGATKLHEEWICGIAKSIRELVLPEYRAGEFRSGGRHRETCGYRISVRVLFQPAREAAEFSTGRSCTRVPARAMQCS